MALRAFFPQPSPGARESGRPFGRGIPPCGTNPLSCETPSGRRCVNLHGAHWRNQLTSALTSNLTLHVAGKPLASISLRDWGVRGKVPRVAFQLLLNHLLLNLRDVLLSLNNQRVEHLAARTVGQQSANLLETPEKTWRPALTSACAKMRHSDNFQLSVVLENALLAPKNPSVSPHERHFVI